jgi:hypothetical protein
MSLQVHSITLATPQQVLFTLVKVLAKLPERKQQSTQVAGGFGFVAAVLSCKGPCRLFLPVAPFMHNGHDSTIGIRPWTHGVGYGEVLLFFITVLLYEHGIIMCSIGKNGRFQTTKHILASPIQPEQFP